MLIPQKKRMAGEMNVCLNSVMKSAPFYVTFPDGRG